MADEKISSLPVAGTLTGTEKFPFVQAGGTVRSTLNLIAAFISSMQTLQSITDNGNASTNAMILKGLTDGLSKMEFIPVDGGVGIINIYNNAGVIKTTINGLTGITSVSLRVPGGTASQFLKANGTVDNTVYQALLGFTPEDIANKGIANGYPSLDASGLVPSSQLPSYVDDVVEGTYISSTVFNKLSGTPYTPAIGLIYVDTTTNLTYRWSGSIYVKLTDGGVNSFNSRLGAVLPLAGDYTTALVPDSTNKRYVTDADAIVIANTTNTNSGNETASSIGVIVNGASVATPNDTDFIATVESSVVKKITWTNAKAFLKTYFDTLYTTVSAVATQITSALSTFKTANFLDATSSIQTQLNAKESTANKGAANGYPSLDASGLVPSSQLPSYVDDVVEGTYISSTVFNKLSGTPYTPAIGLIYVDTTTNLTYRWSGSIYVKLTDGGVNSFNSRVGAVLPVAGDYTTALVPDSTNKRYVTDADAIVIANTTNTNSGNETASSIGVIVNGATAYTTPLDADFFGIFDFANGLYKKVSWANIKILLQTVANIRTSFQTTPDNTHYPSEKLVKDSLDLKQPNVINNDPSIQLQRFRVKPNTTTRKIAWVGDSTTDQLFSASVGGYPVLMRENPATTDSYAYQNLGYLNGPLYGVQSFNAGSNGNTCLNFISNAIAGKNVSDVATFNPDLIVFCYGINDVRLGACSYATLVSRITSAVNQLQIACPNADIILRMPNSLLYDSANSPVYIDAPISLVKVQGYSDILRNAYRDLTGIFKNVYVLDLQKGTGSIFNETVNTIANKGFYHSDALHPNGEGYAAIIREVAITLGNFGNVRFAMQSVKKLPLIFEKSPYKIKQSYAVSTSYSYLYNPRICEDPKYFNLIVDGIFVGGAAGSYMDIATNTEIASNLYCGAVTSNDIIVQYNIDQLTVGSQGENIENGICAYQFYFGGRGDSGANIRCTGMPAGYPKTQNAGLPLRLYRARPTTQKNDYDPNFTAVFAQSDFTTGTLNYVVQRFGVVAILSSISLTAPTTGGTIDIKKNGTTFATLTIASGATTSTVSGTFIGAGTKGIYFDEGDIISAVINAGFVAGSYIKIELSNH